MKKATDFISSEYGPVDVPIVYCDINTKRNGYVLFSNKRLKGSKKETGVYVKEMNFDSLTQEQEKAMNEHLFLGPANVFMGNEKIKSYKALGVRDKDINNIDGYVFIPSIESEVRALFCMAKAGKYYAIPKGKGFNDTSTFVHELSHVVARRAKKALSKRLGWNTGNIYLKKSSLEARWDGEFDNMSNVVVEQVEREIPIMKRKEFCMRSQQEAVAFYNELKYLRRNNYEAYVARKKDLNNLIIDDKKLRKKQPEYPRKSQGRHPDYHASGLKLCFALEQDVGLNREVEKILKSHYKFQSRQFGESVFDIVKKKILRNTSKKK